MSHRLRPRLRHPTRPSAGSASADLKSPIFPDTDTSLAIGMIAAPRPDVSLETAIQNLRLGTFNEALHVFCEPGLNGDFNNVHVHQNSARLGAFGNYVGALTWLLDHTLSANILIVEDDVAYCRGAHTALIEGIMSFPDYTALSLYTPRGALGTIGPSVRGWGRCNRGWKSTGTLAICFRRSGGIEAFLEFAGHRMWKRRVIPYDAVLYQFYQSRCYEECYTHTPSLCHHIGTTSLLGHTHTPCNDGLDFDPNYR